MFAELIGILIFGAVVGLAAWQFRAIATAQDLKSLQRRAFAILVMGAAGWLLWLLRLGL